MAGRVNSDMITIPRVLYESLLESIRVLTTREELRDILKAFEDIDDGKVYSLQEFKKMAKTLE